MSSIFFWVGAVVCSLCTLAILSGALYYVSCRAWLWFTTSLRADQIFYYIGRRYKTELLREAWKCAKEGDIRKPLVVKYRYKNIVRAMVWNRINLNANGKKQMTIDKIEYTGRSSGAIFGKILVSNMFGTKFEYNVALNYTRDGLNRPLYFDRHMYYVHSGKVITNKTAPLELIRQFEERENEKTI